MVGVGAALLYFLSGNPHPGSFDSNLGFLLGVFPPPPIGPKSNIQGFRFSLERWQRKAALVAVDRKADKGISIEIGSRQV
jgi:hypothetical protein